MNLKVLSKGIEEAGLWGKPLNQFSREEILKLCRIFNAACMENEKCCGTCWYQWWKGLKLWCLHPDHPNPLHAWAWGAGCPDYSYLFDLEIADHKLNRKPRVEL